MTDHTQYTYNKWQTGNEQQTTHKAHITHSGHISTIQIHKATDLLADILNNINEVPTAYVNKQTRRNNIHSGQYEQHLSHNQKREVRDEEQNSTVANNQQSQDQTDAPIEKRMISHDSGIIKTRSVKIIKKQDRLAYV